MLDYLLSACLKCMEKKRKLSTRWRMSRVVLFFCRKPIPIKGLARMAMTRKRSLNMISPNSNWCLTVALGDSKCPFATIIWKSGSSPSFKTVCSAGKRIFRKSASEMALVNAVVSMRPSMVVSPKSIGETTNLLLVFNWWFVDNGKNFVFLSGIVWSSGMISVSMTGFWHFVKLGCGPKFGNCGVWRSCGSTDHKSINAYLSLSDTCESVIISSSFICPSDLSKFFLNSIISWS